MLLAASATLAEPIREWDWHLPGSVYKEMDFTDRAGIDRATKLFQQAIDAERSGRYKVTDIVPRYRAAAGEWRKVQVQGETGDGNESLLAYATFMQGYSRQQAHDRNEAMKLFNEVLDLYPEQKFIAVPARYMLSRVKRELGDIKAADADLEEIVDDQGADGHPIYYNVLSSLASRRWEQCRADEAADAWAKIVFTKGKPDNNLWWGARNNLITARAVGLGFDRLEEAIFAGHDEPKKRAEAVVANAKWMSEIDRYDHHAITQFLNRKYPDKKKEGDRRALKEKILKGYAAWFDGESGAFAGVDDGWLFALAQLRAHAAVEKSEQVAKRVKALERFVTGAKPDQVDGRARTLAYELLAFKQGDAARAVAAMVKNRFPRLQLQSDVENELQNWKGSVMYLNEYAASQPPPSPGDLKRVKYDLAWYYRNRLGDNEKALKIFQELDDPPRSLWGQADCFRSLGKKTEAYKVLVEITSMFPNDAPDAVLRAAQWREQDGEKEKAIALYRQLLKNPKWKESRASSDAHQALERHGIATGGAMTNEVR